MSALIGENETRCINSNSQVDLKWLNFSSLYELVVFINALSLHSVVHESFVNCEDVRKIQMYADIWLKWSGREVLAL